MAKSVKLTNYKETQIQTKFKFTHLHIVKDDAKPYFVLRNAHYTDYKMSLFISKMYNFIALLLK